MSAQRLSDPNSRRHKLQTAALVLALCVIIPPVVGWRSQYSLVTVIVVTLMALGCAVYVIRRDFWWVADEVWDTGGSLRVRCNGADVEVPFSAIERVTLLPRHSRFLISLVFSRSFPGLEDGTMFYPESRDIFDSTAVEAIARTIRAKATRGGAV